MAGIAMSEKNVYYPPELNKGPALSFWGALGLSGLIFLMLPLTQLLSGLKKPSEHVIVDDISLPPPPAPPPEPPPEEKVEPEQVKPELQNEIKPLDLSMLDAALNPGFGDALSIGGAIISLETTPITIDEMGIFELKDLDNNPRRIVAIAPIYPYHLKRMDVEGHVKLLIIIDQRGRVIKATMSECSDKGFVKPSIEAVLQWRFEPGTRNGKPVKVRRMQPMNFRLD